MISEPGQTQSNTIQKGYGTLTSNKLKANRSNLLRSKPASPSKEDKLPAPDRSHILYYLRNRYRQKYPLFNIENCLNYKTLQEENLQALNNSTISEEEESSAQRSLQNIRKGRNSMDMKPIGNSYIAKSKLDSKDGRTSAQKLPTLMKSIRSRSNYSLDKMDQNLEEKGYINSTFILEQDNLDKQTADTSAYYYSRPGTMGYIQKDSSKNLLLSGAESRNTLSRERKVSSKNLLPPPQKLQRKTSRIPSETNETSSLSAKNLTETSEKLDNFKPDKILTYKLLYQKFKDPKNRQRFIKGDISKRYYNGNNIGSNKATFDAVSEAVEIKLINRPKKVTFDKEEKSIDAKDQSFAEKNPKLNHSELGIRHQKLKKADNLESLKNELFEISKQAKEFQENFKEDHNDFQIKFLARRIDQGYKNIEKSLRNNKMSQYDFQKFVKSLLEKKQANQTKNEKN